jgi:hypothetical protein
LRPAEETQKARSQKLLPLRCCMPSVFVFL